MVKYEHLISIINKRRRLMNITVDNFVGHMRTPELVEKILIETKGRPSARSKPDKMLAGISAWLNKEGYAPDYYDNLCKAVQTQDLNWSRDDKGCIIIPAARIMCMLIEASRELGKRTGLQKALLRRYVYISDFVTNRKVADWTWRRLVPLRDSTGKLLSSNPAIQTNQVIGVMPKIFLSDRNMKVDITGKAEPVVAVGEIEINDCAPQEFVDQFYWQFDYASNNVGVGCSRTMGLGRFLRDGGQKVKGKARIEEEEFVKDAEVEVEE